VPVTLSGGGGQPTQTVNEIGFDAALFSLSSATINPAIGPGTVADKQVAHVSTGVGTEAFTVSGSNSNGIPDDLLYSAAFAIGSEVSKGTYNLTPEGTISVSACTGDCDGNGRVSLGELQLTAYLNVTRRNPCDIATPVNNCTVADSDGNGRVSLGELQEAAFRNVTRSCP
jgi:hypothetical protein